jgi:UDP-N-acetylmuramoyl-tripeptide--D-alanyl-D-alanine ligase
MGNTDSREKFGQPVSIEQLYRLFLEHPNICTDTRKVRPGDLFFALRGENFNGNQFAAQALDNGAAYAIIDEEFTHSGNLAERMLRVENVLITLQMLAGYHRNQFSIPVIGITGSNGKTTTKELIHAVLSEKYKTYTTVGNLNNHIGIPLTLLKIKNDAEIAIVEMGANHLKEISGYCVYTRPTHGLITNIGKAHLEGFGSIEGVQKGKGELYDYIRAFGGSVFIMWDYEYLRDMSRGIKEIVTYGTADANISGTVVSASPFLQVRINSVINIENIRTRLTGSYNLPNVLAAVAVGNYFNVDPDDIKSGIENYTPSNSRSQLLQMGTNTVLLDAYNANPSSMRVAIENFMMFPATDKILLLGAMAELGQDSIKEHTLILDLIGKGQWKEVFLVGGDFLKIKHPYKVFVNASDAGNEIANRNFQYTAFLVKGSRSMQMERAVESLVV